MSAYVQRLLDRAGPATRPVPHAVPSGRSLSPIAEADQRLNEPDFVPRVGAPRGPDGDHDHGLARITDDRLPTRRPVAILRPAADRTPPARMPEHDAPVDARPRVESSLRRARSAGAGRIPAARNRRGRADGFRARRASAGRGRHTIGPDTDAAVAEPVTAPDVMSDGGPPDTPRAALRNRRQSMQRSIAEPRTWRHHCRPPGPT